MLDLNSFKRTYWVVTVDPMVKATMVVFASIPLHEASQETCPQSSLLWNTEKPLPPPTLWVGFVLIGFQAQVPSGFRDVMFTE